MKYIKYSEFEHHGIVEFIFPKKVFLGKLELWDNQNFVSMSGEGNDTVFKYLHLDAKKFVCSIVGYLKDGWWPECKSKGDLLKVLEALDKEIEKLYNSSTIQTTTSKGIIITRKHKSIKLNFKL